MQLTRYLEVAKKIRDDAQLVRIVDELRRLIQTNENAEISVTRNAFQSLLLKSRESLIFLRQEQDANAILNELRIEDVFGEANVARFLTAFHAAGDFQNFRGRIPDFAALCHFYNTLKSFITSLEALDKLVGCPRLKSVRAEEAVLQFELLEIGKTGFSIERLGDVLPDIKEFYVQVARLYQSDELALRIAYVDSGSPLMIAIKGDSKVIDAMRKCFESIWDRVRFSKETRAEKKIELLDKSVDLLEKIHSREKDGSLTPEDSLRIRTMLVGSVTGLIAKGTATKETYEP